MAVSGGTPLRAADPRSIGAHVLDSVLGSGGMGRVYLARDERYLARFQREARIACSVAPFCTAEVIDFGVALSLESGSLLTGASDTVGTPAFMAPEQAMRETTTAAADVFAWGGVAAFAGTGQPPFGIAAIPVVMHRVVYDEPRLDGLDVRLLPLVRAAMSKDPADRPSAADLLGELTGSTRPVAGVLAAQSLVPAAARARVPLDKPVVRSGKPVQPRAAAPVLTIPGIGPPPGPPPASALASLRSPTVEPAAPATAAPAKTAPASTVVQPPSEQSRAQYWTGVLATLDQARVAAYETVDVNLLARVYTAGSSARADDEAAIRSMAAIGGHGQGGQQVIEAVTVLTETSSIAVLHFTSHMTPFAIVSAGGAVLSRQPATRSVVQEINLVGTPDGWRVSQVTPA
ncbi:hypothetical protein BBK14_24440 [Parafrankia soli]|uniref:Protein kinase domain-containing protein n=1 Tax=Parafrankia soli TaxID=2599596 RepID=A0A1S1PQS3_9ACTN|nr:protein kinase [Parafrankia soli]OHV23072.1 hypothetical protein BBK14_24440 [Parafrankia soli]